MLSLEGIFFLCTLLWKSGFGAQNMCPSFFPINNKPLVSDQIFSIQIATASQCRYICIQNQECLALVHRNSGSLCTGYKSSSEERSLTEEEKAWKVLRREPCPAGFIWQPSVCKCYSSKKFESVGGSQSVHLCKGLHASATPVEPINKAEMDIIKKMAGGPTVWLGIQRRRNSGILDDFIYYSDGTKVKYTDWMPGDPNDVKNSEDCVAAKGAANYSWADYSCKWKYLLICELSHISK